MKFLRVGMFILVFASARGCQESVRDACYPPCYQLIPHDSRQPHPL